MSLYRLILLLTGFALISWGLGFATGRAWQTPNHEHMADTWPSDEAIDKELMMACPPASVDPHEWDAETMRAITLSCQWGFLNGLKFYNSTIK